MAQGVVDELEVIQIKGHDGQPVTVERPSVHRLLQMRHRGMTIEQARHTVFVGQLIQGFCDVLHVLPPAARE